jgi:hypothetical protein
VEITLRACGEALAIVRRENTPENLQWARGVLEGALADALAAERSGTRVPRVTTDGLIRYRGPKPTRFWLILSKDRSALVSVQAAAAGFNRQA